MATAIDLVLDNCKLMFWDMKHTSWIIVKDQKHTRLHRLCKKEENNIQQSHQLEWNTSHLVHSLKQFKIKQDRKL